MKKRDKDPLLTATEYARVKGASQQAVSRMVRRHGVLLDEKKRARLSVWRAADAVGRMQDKNTLSARAAGLPEGGLAAVGAKAKIKKLALEIEQLQLEVDEAKGEVVARKDAERQMAEVVSLCVLMIEQVLENWAAEARDPAAFEKLRAGMDRVREEIAGKVLEVDG